MEEDYKKYRCIHLADCRGNDKLCKAIQRVKELEEAVDNFMQGKAYSTKQLEKLKNNFIQKSKIREKIEELENWKYDDDYMPNLQIQETIQLLQEILEDK